MNNNGNKQKAFTVGADLSFQFSITFLWFCIHKLQAKSSTFFRLGALIEV